MKVLLAANINSMHTLRWLQALNDRGLRLVVFSLTDVSPGNQGVPAGVKVYQAGFPPELDRSESKLQKVKYLFTAKKLRRILKAEKPDLLHAHYASSYGFISALSGFGPLLVSVWGSDIYEFPRSSFIAAYMTRYTFRKANRLLSTSRVMAAEVMKYTTKVPELTPFGINTGHFRNTRPRHPYPGEGLVIGCVKSLEPVYGHEILIRAVAAILKSKPERLIQLLIVGEGSLRNALEKLVGELNLTGKVTFTGFVPQESLPEVFSRMDIFVMPSLQESFGVSALEAASCGLPVVASRVGGLPEVIADGVTGRLFDAGDVDGLVSCLEPLLDSESLRTEMGRKGRERVMENYEWSDCVSHMLDVYYSVLRNYNHPGPLGAGIGNTEKEEAAE